MISEEIIKIAIGMFDLYTANFLSGTEVDDVIGIEEGPCVGDEIKLAEASFNDTTYVYDATDQKTVIGKVSEHKTVLHLARCDEGYHLFFAKYDETVDLFGDYVFLGLIPEGDTLEPIDSKKFENYRTYMKLMETYLALKSKARKYLGSKN